MFILLIDLSIFSYNLSTPIHDLLWLNDNRIVWSFTIWPFLESDQSAFEMIVFSRDNFVTVISNCEVEQATVR